MGTASLTVESSHTFLRCTVRCQSFVACVTTTTLQHHSPHLFDAFSYSRNAEQLQPSRLDFRSASKCLKQPPKPPPRLVLHAAHQVDDRVRHDGAALPENAARPHTPVRRCNPGRAGTTPPSKDDADELCENGAARSVSRPEW